MVHLMSVDLSHRDSLAFRHAKVNHPTIHSRSFFSRVLRSRRSCLKKHFEAYYSGALSMLLGARVGDLFFTKPLDGAHSVRPLTSSRGLLWNSRMARSVVALLSCPAVRTWHGIWGEGGGRAYCVLPSSQPGRRWCGISLISLAPELPDVR